MSGDEEHPFLPISDPSEACRGDLLPVEGHFRAHLPRLAHPCAEDEIDENVGLLRRMARIVESGNNLPAVLGDLEPLKGEAFSGALGAHKHCEVAKGEIGLAIWAKFRIVSRSVLPMIRSPP